MSPPPKMEVSQPRRFTARAILMVICHGLLALLPVLIFVPLALLVFFRTGSFPLFIIVTLPAAILPVYFFPLLLGNSYLNRLVGATAPDAGAKAFLVQMTASPRLYSGFRALMDDADDVGHLTITDDELVFDGDAVKLHIPLGRIRQVESQNIGWRGMWLCGSRLWIEISGLSKVMAIEFCDRSALTTPGSRRKSAELERELRARIRKSTEVAA